MTARIIDGTAIAKQIRLEIREAVDVFKKKTDITPKLGVLLVGNKPSSLIYVRKKQEACEEVGIASQVVHLFADGLVPDDAQQQIFDTIEKMNVGVGYDCHGILVQLPLTAIMHDGGYELAVKRELAVMNRIDPLKDVDVLCAENVGLLVQGHPRYKPCTPHGIQQMLYRSGISLAGKHVVVINRSNIVGKPLSSMLIQDCDDYANATVTVCHNRTPPELLEEITKSADIIIVAVGIPDFLKADMISPGSIIIDVGINRLENNKIVGDVHKSVWDVAEAVSPVPGGVGPLTVAMLLQNTLQAAIRQSVVYKPRCSK